MAVYFFNLKQNNVLIRDRNGTICENDESARDHARGVAKELMRHREVGCRAWRLQVCNVLQTPLFEFLFVDEDETLDALPPRMRDNIRTLSATFASTWDGLNRMRRVSGQLQQEETLTNQSR